jgi:hypothetical protein
MIGPAGLIKVKATDKAYYLSRGYEPVDKTGAVETNPIQEKSLDEMKIDELRQYAVDNNIDIEGIKLKPDILAAIKKADSEKTDKNENGDPENTQE